MAENNFLRILAESALMFRSRFGNHAGRTFDGKRDLYKALGYKVRLLPEDYRLRYTRNAVANRVVKALPKSTWRGGAEIVEDQNPDTSTEFEKAWFDFERQFRLWTIFQRADILAGIGRYAVVLIGAPGELEQPLTECKLSDIAYFTPFAEEDAPIQLFDIDITSPRFGLPLYYSVKRTSMSSPQAMNTPTIGRRVHFSRIVHVADGLLDDNVYGEPRLECVWNLLDDLEKVSGGGAEAFWKRADQGLQFDLDDTLDVNEQSKEDFKKQIDEYEHGLRRVLLTRGLDMKSIGSDVADFSQPVNSIIAQISAGTGIPQRVLMGSEQGKLAAKMDRSNWDDRVSDRRIDFAEPYIVRPFIARMTALGVLPTPKLTYEVRWPELKVMDDQQRAVVAGEWATLNAATPGVFIVTPDEIRTRVLGLGPLKDQGPLPVIPAPPQTTSAKIKAAKAVAHVHRVADTFRPGAAAARLKRIR